MVKTALVHLGGTTADEVVLAQGISVARSFGAHLECLHVRPDKGYLLNLAATNALGVGVEPNVGEILMELEKGSKERAETARKAFEKIIKAADISTGHVSAGPSARFVEKAGDHVEVLIGEIYGHDLAVVSGGSVEHGLRAGDRARVLVAGGRPLVLTPPTPRDSAPETIAIAWKPSPESSRALASAIPFLNKAKKAVVLTAAEGSYEAGGEATRAVLSYLRWHDVNATAREVLPAGRAASEAILEAAREERADMLVMGAYGRGRLSEIVFGGFTQHVLTSTELPVFLLH